MKVLILMVVLFGVFLSLRACRLNPVLGLVGLLATLVMFSLMILLLHEGTSDVLPVFMIPFISDWMESLSRQ